MTMDGRPVNERLSDIERQFQRKYDIYGPLPTFEVGSLPSPSDYLRGLIYVSDETGGATVAFSDGTNWRRVQDRAVVS